MINPRDFNGEIMMNLTLKYYPHKVNQDLFRQTLLDKYESNLIKMNSFEKMLGMHDENYKLINPEAVAHYMGP